MSKAFIRCVVVSVIVVLVAVFPPMVVVAQDSSSSISSARQQLVSCYNAAKEAETAGANISSLTVVLNEAGSLLSQAELAYSKEDFGSAQSLAEQSSQRLDGFVATANSLRDSAVQQGTIDFWVYTVGSGFGAILVVLIGAWIWRVLNKKGKRVEVLSVESE